MLRIDEIRLRPGEDESVLPERAAARAASSDPGFESFPHCAPIRGCPQGGIPGLLSAASGARRGKSPPALPGQAHFQSRPHPLHPEYGFLPAAHTAP